MVAYYFVEKIAQLLELVGIVNGCFADTVGGLVPLQPVYPVGAGDKVDPQMVPVLVEPRVIGVKPATTQALKVKVFINGEKLSSSLISSSILSST